MGNSKVLHPYLYQQRNKNGPFARRRGRHATAERARLSGKTFQRTFRMAARRDAMQQKSPRTSRVGGLRNQMHGRIGAVHAGARRVWQPRCHRILVRPEVLRPCFSVRYALKAAILLRFRPSEFAGMRDSHPIGQKNTAQMRKHLQQRSRRLSQQWLLSRFRPAPKCTAECLRLPWLSPTVAVPASALRPSRRRVPVPTGRQAP